METRQVNSFVRQAALDRVSARDLLLQVEEHVLSQEPQAANIEWRSFFELDIDFSRCGGGIEPGYLIRAIWDC